MNKHQGLIGPAVVLDVALVVFGIVCSVESPLGCQGRWWSRHGRTAAPEPLKIRRKGLGVGCQVERESGGVFPRPSGRKLGSPSPPASRVVGSCHGQRQ